MDHEREMHLEITNRTKTISSPIWRTDPDRRRATAYVQVNRWRSWVRIVLHCWIWSPTAETDEVAPNDKSANYHPANYNRCAAVLRKYGKSAPAADVVEGPRRLDKR